ncbi:hypothetical protein [Bradyrhizobium sp. 191]|uniref:hypothetical protein n=1 Tax=Bradyrhizobium sp. 191 TaxID=2782659 RepID=UPI001FFF8CC5|nr:hypothetical protein [Bradyrhizobium sp. 191]UPJ68538.1 hypothetical protein IVB23_15510 [Bradyrhizobium sp. 191]
MSHPETAPDEKWDENLASFELRNGRLHAIIEGLLSRPQIGTRAATVFVQHLLPAIRFHFRQPERRTQHDVYHVVRPIGCLESFNVPLKLKCRNGGLRVEELAVAQGNAPRFRQATLRSQIDQEHGHLTVVKEMDSARFLRFSFASIA